MTDATAVLALPAPYRVRLRTTHWVERLNEEFRRRERVIRIVPNRESVVRLVGALLMERGEVWTTGKRYFHDRLPAVAREPSDANRPVPVHRGGAYDAFRVNSARD